MGHLLQNGTERWRQLFAESRDAICITTQDGRLVDINPAGLALFACTQQEVLGQYVIPAHASPEDRYTLMQLLDRTGSVQDYEIKLPKKDGMLVDCLLSASSHRALDGSILGTMVIIRDVTESKQVERALRESEERYRALAESVNDFAICLLDGQGRVTSWNSGAERMRGYTPEEILGRHFSCFYTDEDRDLGKPEKQLRLARDIGRLTEHGWRMRKNGSAFWAEVVLVPWFGPNGEVRGFVNVTRDINETKMTQELLHEANKTLQAIVESSPLPIVVADRDLHVVIWNPAAERTFGWSKEEVLGRRLPSFPPERVEPFHSLLLRTVFQGETLQNLEVSRPRKDGSWMDLSLSMAPFYDTTGAVSHGVAIVADVTEAKARDKILRDSRARLELLHAIASGVHVGASAEDVLQRTISQLSRVFSDTRVAYASGEGHGLFRVTHCSHPSLVGVIWELTGTALQNLWAGSPLIVEDVQNPEEESKMPLRGLMSTAAQALIVEPVRDSEGIIGLLWLGSEKPRKWSSEIETLGAVAEYLSILLNGARLQESLRQSEMMAAMGALLGGVAHEVRNPLFSISATVEAFEANFEDRKEFKEYITALREEVNRLNHLMEELLEYGKSGKLEFSETPISNLLSEALLACTALAVKRNVKLQNEVDLAGLIFPMDGPRISQAVQNILDNAIRHSPPGGRVLLEAHEVHKGEDPWVEINVEDQGKGFREEDLPHVFQPFFSRRAGGTGLGLSIAQRIIQEHSGSISAHNRPEKGAVMTLRIPAARTAVKHSGSATRAAS